MIILDTNVLIEILKNNSTTLTSVEQLAKPVGISTVTVMELLFGARNKNEQKALKKFINNFKIVHLSEEISIKATSLIDNYAKSHGLDIPDALITATALCLNVELFTYNARDFLYIEQLKLKQ